jgi:hypothetical protein
VNGHTATIRSLGITGVLLLLALVLLALVSAIFAFDRWPDSGGAGTVERVAVDRPDARRVETVLVRSRRPAPVVRGAFVARTTTSAIATASGAGDAILVGDRESAGQSDGGGFGPPPPAVPFAPPGEGGGGTARFTGSGGAGGTTPPSPEPPSVIRQATCGARDALGQAGEALDPACEPNPGQRSFLARTVSGTVTAADELTESVTLTVAP